MNTEQCSHIDCLLFRILKFIFENNVSLVHKIYVNCIMPGSANSHTNVKIDINCITDFQSMPEYINNRELGIFVFKVTYLSIR